MILSIPVGFDALSTEGRTLVMVRLFGVTAFPATAFFLVSCSRIRSGLSAHRRRLGMLGAIVPSSSASFVVPLAAGSAMLIWRLARIGVVQRLVPVVQAPTAILFTVGLGVGLASDPG